MSATLYRKYRPKNFAEVIGQKHIVQTLSNAIKNNRVGQAFLFTGPRGTGKTSIARILAKTVNCEKLDGVVTCETCQACKMITDGKALDIIEIDAASNTGVENIRELRETINFPPTALKFKVYIIDEVHMLSTGAFNALLKTLEEPPSHVIFILATTEIHKVPETIISRCQRFDFARLPIQNIIEKLKLIAAAEEVQIDADSLEMIAIAAEGGMRDAESLLGQIISLEDKNITIKEVEEILGTTDRKFAHEIAGLIFEQKTTEAIEKINNILIEGYDLQVFTKSLVNYLRQLMILKVSPELKTYFTFEITGEQIEKMLEQIKNVEMAKIISAINLFLDAQNKISASILPQLPLEIAIIKATNTFPAEPVITNPKAAFRVQAPRPSATPTLSPDETQIAQEFAAEEIAPIDEASVPAFCSTDGVADLSEVGNLELHDVTSQWNRLLADIEQCNHSLRTLLANCQVFKVQGREITLTTPYDFYKEKLINPQNRLTVETVFGKILGLKITLKTLTCKEAGIEPPRPAFSNDFAQGENVEKNPPAGEPNSLLTSALEIMGGKVVE
jgi:DNA polymerase-3 subunit gamma/tau